MPTILRISAAAGLISLLLVGTRARAAVTADRFGGFEDSCSYGDGAGRASPGVSRAYEALVVAQACQPTRRQPLATPTGATAEALREAGRIRWLTRRDFDDAVEECRRRH